MKIGTLFSGIGSPEQGAKRVYGDKLELVFACEWDKYARQSFLANYEIDEKHFHSDINDLDSTQYKDKIDVLIGGSPCQDFSIAGLRAGIDGKRGQLIWQYYRIITEIMPPVFIYENVKGMVSDKGGRTLQDFLTVFRELGYFCHYEVLNTKDYGVPQNRERIFIVGFLDHEQYYRFQFAPKQKLTKRLKDILEDNVEEKYYLSDRFIKTSIKHKERHTERGNGFSFEPKTPNDIASCLQSAYGNRQTDTFIKHPSNQLNPTYKSQANTIHNINLVAPTLCAFTHGYAGGYIKEPQCNVVGMLDIKGNEQIRRVYGVDGTSPCLQTMQGGNREPKILDLTNDFGENKTREYTQFDPTLRSERFGLATEQNYRIRKLTPRECFRLQDFPDTFKFVVSNSQLYKQAGNSISVNIMEMIFNQIEKSRIINLNGSLF